MKVDVTIRCNRCDAIETVTTEAWALLKTSCGCAGPYRVIDRKPLEAEPTAEAAESAADEAPPSASAPSEN